MNASTHLDSTTYYLSLCGSSDKAIQFAYGLVLCREQAVEILNKVYERFSKDLPLPTESEKSIHLVLKEIWVHVRASSSLPKPTQIEHKLFSEVLKKLSVYERAALVLHDHLGLTQQDSADLMEVSFDDFLQNLAKARSNIVREEF